MFPYVYLLFLGENRCNKSIIQVTTEEQKNGLSQGKFGQVLIDACCMAASQKWFAMHKTLLC